MSNVLPIGAPPDPRAAAAAWVARLDAGPLAPEERRALDAWLALDPEHRRLLDEHAVAWSRIRAAFRAPRATGRSSVRRGSAVVAALLVAVTLGWWGTRSTDGFDGTFRTAVGEQQSVQLPDGSRVVLNTGSVLDVRFTHDRRALMLSSGEAVFDVVRDARRPFEVTAGDTIARAVGTRFAVRVVSPGEVAVTVSEGTVDVVKAPQQDRPEPVLRPTARVVAGERATTSGAVVAVAALSDAEKARLTGWSDGGVAFRDEPLGEVLGEINRYSSRPVRVTDPRAAAQRVSGYFAVGQLSAFLESVATTTGLHVRATPEEILLTPVDQALRGMGESTH